MRAFVIFVACLAVVSADIGLDLQRGGGSGVSIDYVPTTYQDSSAGASADARSFGGAGGAGAGAGANAAAFGDAGGAGFGGAGVGAGSSGFGARFTRGFGGSGFGGGEAAAADSPGLFGGSGFGGSGFGGSGFGGRAAAKAQTRVIVKPAEVQKHFYYHVAPEDPKVQAEADTLTITPKKHYKIIFIKAPTVSANAGSSAYAASQTEEKTLVYVLVNKPAQAKAGAAANASSFVSGKPEVYFIKYQGPQAKVTGTGKSADAYAGAISFGSAGFGGAGDAVSGDIGATPRFH